ncbi:MULTISPECIES: phosphoadenosine phosphosulfate reductase family protein [unclassified Clostridium]|uniref:phosphoadenosine phosphosulfate reductase family protein n=1 Tax=unclassified Clostridium TaxID=2614128 RepID=UPI000297C52B|nr:MULTISPECIES: phosphoadenosine phosphosulfate reductase family protein [unclassified Clostridium]EKQ56292.1 MAG: PAPS reductase/FAD synthetase family protein [Clostridium sp. Maddingley MBC34-26]
MLTRRRKDYQPIVDTSKLVKKSISRLIEFQNRDPNRITIVAFSGGKDSIVIYLLAILSGIKFVPIYSPTSADPPELIWFILRIFNPWAKSNGYPEVIFQKYNKWKKGSKKGKLKTMWALLSNRAIPPSRLKRYCCSELKERTGEAGDTVITGVRWEESEDRSKQSMVNFFNGKIMVRIIVDWKETDVWSFIIENNIPYCELYDQGWDRLGCIGCPLGTNQKKELAAYPNFKRLYIRSFNNMVNYRISKGLTEDRGWRTGEDIMKWWVGDCKKKREETEGQCSMF